MLYRGSLQCWGQQRSFHRGSVVLCVLVMHINAVWDVIVFYLTNTNQSGPLIVFGPLEHLSLRWFQLNGLLSVSAPVRRPTFHIHGIFKYFTIRYHCIYDENNECSVRLTSADMNKRVSYPWAKIKHIIIDRKMKCWLFVDTVIEVLTLFIIDIVGAS